MKVMSLLIKLKESINITNKELADQCLIEAAELLDESIKTGKKYKVTN